MQLKNQGKRFSFALVFVNGIRSVNYETKEIKI